MDFKVEYFIRIRLQAKQTRAFVSRKTRLYYSFTGVKNHIFGLLQIKTKISLNSARYRSQNAIEIWLS